MIRLVAKLLMLLVFTSLAFPSAPGAVAGDVRTLTGRASVIDGDTIEIHGTRIRLHGIDAPESAQACTWPDGTTWRCGQKASLALADRVGTSPVLCRGKDVDQYGRMIAVCFSGAEDLNAWMVTEGWAVAYLRFSSDYLGAESRARETRRNIWSGRFVMPWDWRRGQRLDERSPDDQPDGCTIKGNISASGERIYHVPGGRFYDNVRIDSATGERWFCFRDEAEAAGWRRSMQ